MQHDGGDRQESHDNAVEMSPITLRSAPAERSKYQLWPASESASEFALVLRSGPKRSVSIQRSTETTWSRHEQEPKPVRPLLLGRSKTGQDPTTHAQYRENSNQVSVGKHSTGKRSCSAPGHVRKKEAQKAHRGNAKDNSETTVSTDEAPAKGEDPACDSRKSLKRASSGILPADLAILTMFAAPHCHKETEDDFRPPVPPKMLPRESNVVAKTSPLRLLTNKISRSKTVSSSAANTVQEAGRGECSPNQHGELKHLREGSGDSIMDRGRPAKLERNRSEARRDATSPTSSSKSDAARSSLPTGTSPKIAQVRLSGHEVQKLGMQATAQAERFEVLESKDVKALSQRVRLLDERCEQLRCFCKTLRQNRRSLHGRTLADLKSSVVSKQPPESMLQKVETLIELDDTLDEWSRKLERAENQRLRARQKLLEHIAAVLAMPPTKDDAVVKTIVLHTPPESPETPLPRQPDTPMSKRPDAESIKIFAASDVQALLVDIDREIEASVEAGGHWM